MTLRIVPETLLAALWFQCARVLTLNPTFRACMNCGKWFELLPDKRRKQAFIALIDAKSPRIDTEKLLVHIRPCDLQRREVDAPENESRPQYSISPA